LPHPEIGEAEFSCDRGGSSCLNIQALQALGEDDGAALMVESTHEVPLAEEIGDYL